MGFFKSILKAGFQIGKSGLSKAYQFGKWSYKYTTNQLETPSTKYGSARFATPGEVGQLLNSKNTGLAITGNPSYTLDQKRSYMHSLISAPSGMGKTSAFILPSIFYQLADRSNSVVVTDVSGEIYAATSGFAQEQGYKIQVFNISDPKQSHTFNPMTYTGDSTRKISQLATTMIHSAFPNVTGDSSFWLEGASNYIEVMGRLLSGIGEPYYNLHNIRHLINAFDPEQQGGAVGKLFLGDKVDAALRSDFHSIAHQPHQVAGGMLSTAKAALKVFSDPLLCQLFAEQSLDFDVLRRDPTIIYVTCRESELDFYRFALDLFYQALFSYLMQENTTNRGVFCYLDEYGQMSIDLSSILSTIRKYSVSISIVLQDSSQLEYRYGKAKAQNIFNNCASKIFLPGISHEAAKHLEMMLGNQTIEETDFWTQNKTEYGKSLLSATEIRTMSQGEGLFLHANIPPIKIPMVPYFKNKQLLKWSQLGSAPLPKNQLPKLMYMELPEIKSSSSWESTEDNGKELPPMPPFDFDL